MTSDLFAIKLNDYEQLIGAIADNADTRIKGSLRLGVIYCHHCGEDCPMDVAIYEFGTTMAYELMQKELKKPAEELTEDAEPAIFSYRCVNCDTRFAVLLYMSFKGPELAIFPNSFGGLSTPSTPPEVAFYLDEAYSSQNVGAFSAACSMYRAALHQILEGHGLSGKLNVKIVALEKQITEKTAPKWAYRLNAKVLTVLKKIGDAHMHAGENTKAEILSSEDISNIQGAFRFLLNLIYERPKEELARLARLKEILGNATHGTADPPSTENTGSA